MVPIFEKVVAARDRYGLHAYLTALENTGMRGQMEVELRANMQVTEKKKKTLQAVLETGTLPAEEPATAESLPNSEAALR
jgi:hypothetical protein